MSALMLKCWTVVTKMAVPSAKLAPSVKAIAALPITRGTVRAVRRKSYAAAGAAAVKRRVVCALVAVPLGTGGAIGAGMMAGSALTGGLSTISPVPLGPTAAPRPLPDSGQPPTPVPEPASIALLAAPLLVLALARARRRGSLAASAGAPP